MKNRILKIRIERDEQVSRLTKYEQETVINFNVAESDIVVYTRDKGTMKSINKSQNQLKFGRIKNIIGSRDLFSQQQRISPKVK